MNATRLAARIVVGVDGSPGSRAALRWAGERARLLDGRVVAVHGLGSPGRRASRTDAAQRRYEEITELVELEWCQELVRVGIPFSTAVRPGPPVEVVSTVADQHPAGLVVGNRGMGSTPPGGLGRTTWRMLQHGRQRVLVVPEHGTGARHLGLRDIVVGFDGSAASERVLEAVGEMAVAFHSRVTFVRALESRPHGPPSGGSTPTCHGRPAGCPIRGSRCGRSFAAATPPTSSTMTRAWWPSAPGGTAPPPRSREASPGRLLHETLRPTLVAPSPGAQRRAKSLASWTAG